MADWDPEQYLQFEEYRLRPAIDLIARIKLDNPKSIVDLGCGPATSTKLLGERFIGADVVGVDNSGDMLERAKSNYRGAKYIAADIETWHSASPVDLLFANVVFHWLPDHNAVISRLAGMLKPQGALAFQMPDNLAEPCHLAIGELHKLDYWQQAIGKVKSQRGELGTIDQYYCWMAKEFARVDIWRSNYAHVLESHQKIVDWMEGAALRPYLENLDTKQRNTFLEAYLAKIKQAYVRHNNGSVILGFPRLFVIGYRS